MEESTNSDDEPKGAMALAQQFIDTIVGWGVDGLGPLKGAQQIAEEHRAKYGDDEKAIDAMIKTHVRLVTATGFATGLGGGFTLPVSIPTDITVFYALSARCAAGVAYLRGYDIGSDEVRSVVLLSLLGSAGSAVLADLGVELGTKAAISALKKLPGRVLTRINQRVGFRLVTKFGEKGVINITKWVPLVGGFIGGGVNHLSMTAIGKYARLNFPK